MASLESRLHSAFVGDAGVSALIGTRLYDRQLPPTPTYPCAAYQRISTIPLYSQERGSEQGGVGWARFQISMWASGQNGGNDSDAIATAFANALQGFNLWSPPASPVVVNTAPNYVLNRRAGIEPNTNPPVFKVFLDIKVWYQEF